MIHGGDDHLRNPPPVPRGIVPAAVIAATAKPIVSVLQMLPLARPSLALGEQFTVRICMALATALGLGRLRESIRRRHGRDSEVAFTLIACSQFHTMFYASRALQNTFAMPLIAFAGSQLLDSRHGPAVSLSLWVSLCVRSDVAPIAGAFFLRCVFDSGALRALWAVMRAVFAMAVTIAMDCLFWRRWAFPEAESILFNIVNGGNTDWGVLPWHWYFTSAWPKSLGPMALFVVHGATCRPRGKASTALFLAAMAHVLALSIVPHKELRFLLPSLQLLSVPASVSLPLHVKGKGVSWRKLAAVFAFLCSVVYSLVGLTASRCNYPGGEAVLALVDKIGTAESGKCGTLLLSTKAAQEGASKFVLRALPDCWRVVKEHNIVEEGGDVNAMMERTMVDVIVWPSEEVEGFDRIGHVDQFSGLAFGGRLWFLPHVRKVPSLFLYTRRGFLGE